jgi:malonyl-CoA decarboxylase
VSRISYLSELLSSVFIRQESDTQEPGEGSFTELCDSLLAHDGERSGSQIARGLLNRFAESSEEEKIAFFQMLSARFDINADHVVRAAQHYAQDKSTEHLSTLMDSVEPRRQELFRRLNCVSGATNELVSMRALLLDACKQHPDLKRIDLDFQHLFRSWFNQGFLVMREIDWHTPANVLEKIIEYEAVHAINSWSALRSRLEPSDRRCFAFFHPAMLDEPLIFVEVALTCSAPQTIREVLESNREILRDTETTTAVFYSISNCQKGLAGVSFGNSLIKQVAKELSKALPELQTFRTLSPVPGFMRWVRSQLDALKREENTVSQDSAVAGPLIAAMRLAEVIADSGKYDFDDADKLQVQQLVAHYLLQAKREDGQPIDPVARFHLGNGASLDAVMPCADVYDSGLQQSAGVMVSYLYDLSQVDDNHEAYANERQVIASDDVKSLCSVNKRVRKRA